MTFETVQSVVFRAVVTAAETRDDEKNLELQKVRVQKKKAAQEA
jgi:hypothetical protein